MDEIEIVKVIVCEVLIVMLIIGWIKNLIRYKEWEAIVYLMFDALFTFLLIYLIIN